MDQSRFDDVISLVPVLANERTLDVDLFEDGLTNTNYVVSAGGEQFVVRIVGGNGRILVGDRTVEEAYFGSVDSQQTVPFPTERERTPSPATRSSAPTLAMMRSRWQRDARSCRAVARSRS